MEIFTYDRNFFEQDLIDRFESAIWTERFLGDGDFTLVVPAEPDMIAMLPQGQLMGCVGSDQPMILDTVDIKDGLMKATGITLTQWLNNRIIRTTNDHRVREWLLTGLNPGDHIDQIVTNFCMNSSYLNGTIDIGIPVGDMAHFPIPGLQIASGFHTGSAVDISVPFGPVYDAIKSIASTYNIGLMIRLDGVYEDYYILSFVSYYGTDRTSDQSVNPTIRFSEEMDTLTEPHDLQSTQNYRNYVYMYAPGINDDTLAVGNAGRNVTAVTDAFATKVFIGNADDVTIESLGGTPTATDILNVLNSKAGLEAWNHSATVLVDGQIVDTGQIKYGVDYFLGDIVEVEGNTGVVSPARITEWIRSQDSSGERAYPTLAS